MSELTKIFFFDLQRFAVNVTNKTATIADLGASGVTVANATDGKLYLLSAAGATTSSESPITGTPTTATITFTNNSQFTAAAGNA